MDVVWNNEEWSLIFAVNSKAQAPKSKTWKTPGATFSHRNDDLQVIFWGLFGCQLQHATFPIITSSLLNGQQQTSSKQGGKTKHPEQKNAIFLWGCQKECCFHFVCWEIPPLTIFPGKLRLAQASIAKTACLQLTNLLVTHNPDVGSPISCPVTLIRHFEAVWKYEWLEII